MGFREAEGVNAVALWWLVGGVILGFVEIFTVDLFFLTLALAALLTAGGALLGLPLWGQVLLFVAVSGLFLVLVRPWAKSVFAASTPDLATNVQGLVGKKATVTQDLASGEGRIRLEGETWSARALDGERFPVGAQVQVIRIEGATAIVGEA